MSEPNGDDKFFLAFMSVAAVVLGLLFACLGVLLFVAMWQAGLMNFLFWVGLFSFVGWLSRLVYKAALKNGWMDKL